jgi:hypothetical protein
MQDSPPAVESLVRGEDHRPLAQVAIVDHVVEHVGGIGPVGQVADLVHDQHVGMGVGRQRIVELSGMTGVGQVLDQLRGSGEERVESVLDRPVGDRDGQVGLATTGLAVQDERATLGDEVRSEEGSEQGWPQGGLQREVEVVDGLEVREAGLAGQTLQSCLTAVCDLVGDEHGEEVTVGPLLGFGLGGDLAVDATHVGQVQSLQQRVEIDIGDLEGWARGHCTPPSRGSTACRACRIA